MFVRDPSRWHQRGGTLIEVLVAVVIAAIGIMALVGVNAASLRYAKISEYRATATQLATDIAERMRANRAAAVLGNYQLVNLDWADQTAANTLSNALAALVMRCNTVASVCSPADLANEDLYTWRESVRDVLPSGSVFLNWIGDEGVPQTDAYDLWVAWRDPALANTDERARAVNECPDGLSLGGDAAVRCIYFRINL